MEIKETTSEAKAKASSKNPKIGSKQRLAVIATVGLLLITGALAYKLCLRKLDMVQKIRGKETVDSIIAKYGKDAHGRLTERFRASHIPYPPAAIKLLGLKSEKVLEIYAKDRSPGNTDQTFRYVCTYPILGTSGVLGPKLAEGDKQMPEGFYRIREFEPNSSYHVALRVDYPSPFDKEMGKADGRSKLGSDIMIHGYNASIGCLAMGDMPAEDLFVLVHDVGLDNTELIMSPYDFRKPPEGISLPDKPSWITQVYENLKKQIALLPLHSPAPAVKLPLKNSDLI